MNPRLALACLAAVLVGIVAAAAIAGPSWAFARAASEVSPDAMAQKARDVMAHLGYTGKPASSDWGYAMDGGMLGHLSGLPKEQAWQRIASGRPPAITFWYRQSPERLSPKGFEVSHVNPNDPPVDTFGMAGVRLDPLGRLSRLVAYPQSQVQPADIAPPFQWQKLFEAAKLDMTRFTPAAPQIVPFFAFDQRSAWTGTENGTALRVEAATWHGLPVFFSLTRETATAPSAAQASFDPGDMAQVLFAVFLLVGEVILAWRNLKLHRGDARGAMRLGGFVAVAAFLYHMLSQSHGLDYPEYATLLRTLGASLLAGGRMSAAYLAFEPFIRRRWPNMLISWTRALSGAWRDPLVGRHLLMGACGAAAMITVYKLFDLLVGPSSGGARSPDLYAVANSARTLGQLSKCLGDAVGDSCWAAFLVFVFALVFRKPWAAAAAAALLWGVVQAAGSPLPVWVLTLWLFVFGVLFFLLFRYGLLACFAYAFTGEVIMDLPTTLDTNAWYFGASALGMLVVIAATLWAYRTAVGTKRAFSG
jgi:hypothetical protein